MTWLASDWFPCKDKGHLPPEPAPDVEHVELREWMCPACGYRSKRWVRPGREYKLAG